MWQVRDHNSGDDWRNVTCDFYWNTGRMYMCWPGQSQYASYALGNVRWRTLSALPNRQHRLRATNAEAA